MSLQKRLTWLLVAFVGFALVATFGTIYAVRLHVEDAIVILQQSMDEAAWLDRVRLKARAQHLLLREVIDGLHEADDLYLAQRDGFFDELRQVAEFTLREKSANEANELLELAARLRQECDRCLLLTHSGECEAAREVLRNNIETQLLPPLDLQLRTARAVLADSRTRSVDDLVATNTQVLILSLVIAVFGIGLVTIGTALVHRWIIAPIRRLQEATQEFSQGNLAFRLQLRSSGELGELAQAMNRMAEGLAEAQAELQVSETKYRSLFRDLRDAAIICDEQGQVIECHDGETNLLGPESRSRLGQSLLELWPHWRAETLDWPKLIERVRTRETRVRLTDLQLPHGDGKTTAIVDLIAYPVEFGRARYVAIVLRDVTERKRTEDALRESERRYRLLFERNLAGVYRTTLDGTILDCNESMAAMLGCESRDELQGRRALDFYVESANRESFLARLRKTGTLTNSELRLRRKDGTPIHVLENAILLPDEEGTPAIIQGTMIDITERKQAEEVLRENEERFRLLTDDLRRVMQRLHTVREEERTRITRELHDELGQALTALNMDLHWLTGRSWHESEVTQARLRSMRELLNTTIQAVRRICADLRPAVLDDFGLTAAIEWQAQEFQSRTGIRCQLALPTTQPDLPEEQSTAVFRIFQESLTNIARHAQATEAKVTLLIRPDTLVLEIVDNGIGISEDDLAGSRSIGLVGMRERAIGWRGRVDITGIPNQGTTVTLHMPIEQGAVEPES